MVLQNAPFGGIFQPLRALDPGDGGRCIAARAGSRPWEARALTPCVPVARAPLARGLCSVSRAVECASGDSVRSRAAPAASPEVFTTEG
ncbi:hypothetical protein NDU88_000397 [Pleurodeles waltl]|uniref:Uncharacterized protein n=1 Tax=Pleurodeles waltl TaxID=8319 RepID=A0AAV7LWC7_PLEWA|nr:hypothetical protein NDU88_000397 [Pleurodeles waltl]